jgi:hypothetical protein
VSPFRQPANPPRRPPARAAEDDRALAIAALAIGGIGVVPSLLGGPWGAQPSLAALLVVAGLRGLLRGSAEG